MIALVFAALLMGKGVSTVFFGFLSFLALKEFLSIVPTRMTDRRVILWLYLAIPVHYYWVYAEWYGMFIIFIPVYLFLFIPTRMLLVGETEGFIRSAARYHWAVMATVFCLSHIPYLLVLPASVNPAGGDRKSTRLNSSHVASSYAVFCLKKKKNIIAAERPDVRTADTLAQTISVSADLVGDHACHEVASP